MYAQLEERFESVNYKKCKLLKGEIVETGEKGILKGYISFDLTHLASAGIDLTDISASVITDSIQVKEGDLIEVNLVFVKVKKMLHYRDPFSEGYSTFELLT